MDDGYDINGTAAPASKVLKADDFEALARARHGIDEARAQAEAIVASAHGEAETIRAAAREQGQAEVSALVTEHLVRMQREVATSHDAMTKVVMTALRRVLKPVPPAKAIAGAVERALEEVDTGGGAHLIVAPPLMNLLREHLAERGVAPETLEVRGDPDCPPESSILRSAFGDIELGIEFQLRAIERGLRAAEEPPA